MVWSRVCLSDDDGPPYTLPHTISAFWVVGGLQIVAILFAAVKVWKSDRAALQLWSRPQRQQQQPGRGQARMEQTCLLVFPRDSSWVYFNVLYIVVQMMMRRMIIALLYLFVVHIRVAHYNACKTCAENLYLLHPPPRCYPNPSIVWVGLLFGFVIHTQLRSWQFILCPTALIKFVIVLVRGSVYSYLYS